MPDKKIIVNMVAYTMGDEGMCGGSRIFLELAKRWLRKKNVSVRIFVTESGYSTCVKNGLIGAQYNISKGLKYKRFGLAVFYAVLTIKGFFQALRSGIPLAKRPADQINIVYSTSDFWPDAIPAWIMSRVIPASRWIAGFYLCAPMPLSEESPYRGKNFLRGLMYYISQYPVYLLVKRYADMVFVTSQPDVEKFITQMRGKSDIIVVLGGVDFVLLSSISEPGVKTYDAVFMGRFHPQKGVIELLDVWKLVLQLKRDAKLLIVGYGPLEKEIEDKITSLELQDNVFLHGYIDGIEKIKLLKSCRIVVHPATYDSGGMAACEAMACGLPGVSFDLDSLRTYYPKGMLKVPCYDLQIFAKTILRLINDNDLFKKTRREALEWAAEWDWDARADNIFNRITKGII